MTLDPFSSIFRKPLCKNTLSFITDGGARHIPVALMHYIFAFLNSNERFRAFYAFKLKKIYLLTDGGRCLSDPTVERISHIPEINFSKLKSSKGKTKKQSFTELLKERPIGLSLVRAGSGVIDDFVSCVNSIQNFSSIQSFTYETSENQNAFGLGDRIGLYEVTVLTRAMFPKMAHLTRLKLSGVNSKMSRLFVQNVPKLRHLSIHFNIASQPYENRSTVPQNQFSNGERKTEEPNRKAWLDCVSSLECLESLDTNDLGIFRRKFRNLTKLSLTNSVLEWDQRHHLLDNIANCSQTLRELTLTDFDGNFSDSVCESEPRFKAVSLLLPKLFSVTTLRLNQNVGKREFKAISQMSSLTDLTISFPRHLMEDSKNLDGLENLAKCSITSFTLHESWLCGEDFGEILRWSKLTHLRIGNHRLALKDLRHLQRSKVQVLHLAPITECFETYHLKRYSLQINRKRNWCEKLVSYNPMPKTYPIPDCSLRVLIVDNGEAEPIRVRNFTVEDINKWRIYSILSQFLSAARTSSIVIDFLN